jgi:hypothetical protein
VLITNTPRGTKVGSTSRLETPGASLRNRIPILSCDLVVCSGPMDHTSGLAAAKTTSPPSPSEVPMKPGLLIVKRENWFESPSYGTTENTAATLLCRCRSAKSGGLIGALTGYRGRVLLRKPTVSYSVVELRRWTSIGRSSVSSVENRKPPRLTFCTFDRARAGISSLEPEGVLVHRVRRWVLGWRLQLLLGFAERGHLRQPARDAPVF